MKLFDQLTFTGGLNAEYDRLKIPRDSYPLLLNGRIRNGNIQPIRKHVRDTNIPDGTYQNLIAVGDYLICFVSGDIVYKNINTSGPWQRIPGWTAMSSTADEIYATLIPVSTNFLNTTGTPTAPSQAFNPQIAQVPQALFVTDGLTNRLIYNDLSWTTLGDYTTWTMDRPEYVPNVLQSVVSGVKLFAISTDRKKIYQSVSGRYTDFVINLTTSGDKGGNADTTAYAVDFNDLTAIQPTQQGGLLATTLYATYLLLPTDAEIFGEPILSVGDPAFPVGAVNWKSFASILGDVAFIAQSGIHSINVSMQLQTEANNNPFSAKIARYLSNPQTDTCATNYDDYALFAVNTAYGRGVFVYDTLREQFVSLDTGFNTVKKFATFKKAGISRLFFITTDNELYEAYAASTSQITRVLLGDYVYAEEGVSKQMKVSDLFFWFNNITTSDAIRVSFYIDDVLIDAAEMTPEESSITNIPPVSSPLINDKDIIALRYSPPQRTGAKCSIWIEWSGDMELVGVSGEGSKESTVQPAAQILRTVPDNPIIVLSDPAIHTAAATASSFATVTGLTPNDYYYVSGTADLGNQRVTDNVFKANLDTIRLSGTIYNVTSFRDLYLTAKSTPNRHADFLSLGNFTDGTEASWDRFSAIITPNKVFGPAGNKDLDDAVLSWYERRERYFMYRTDLVEFFILSGGWDSANDSVDSSGSPTGTSTEIDGYTSTSNQAQWLRYWLAQSTRTFKVILIGYPPYTDETTYYPGFSPLRWPFAKWGADVVLSRTPGAYERFYINGFPYINLGLGGSTGAFSNATQRSVRRYTAEPSYLSILPRRYSLDIQLNNASGELIDATTVYAR